MEKNNGLQSILGGGQHSLNAELGFFLDFTWANWSRRSFVSLKRFQCCLLLPRRRFTKLWAQQAWSSGGGGSGGGSSWQNQQATSQTGHSTSMWVSTGSVALYWLGRGKNLDLKEAVIFDLSIYLSIQLEVTTFLCRLASFFFSLPTWTIGKCSVSRQWPIWKRRMRWKGVGKENILQCPILEVRCKVMVFCWATPPALPPLAYKPVLRRRSTRLCTIM